MFHLKKSINMQINLMCNKKGFQLAFALNLCFALGAYLWNVFTAWGDDVSTIVSPSAAFLLLEDNVLFDIYITIVPFIVVFPFAMSYVTDKSNMVLPALQVRGGVKTYYITKAVACFLGGVFAFLVPLLLNIFLNEITFPESGVTFIGDLYDWNYDGGVAGTDIMMPTKWVGIWFPKLFMKFPELYNILIAFIFSVAMGVFSVFVYSVSFYLTKHKILLFVPLYVIIAMCNTFELLLGNRYPFTCYKILYYITGNTMYGKNPMFMYTFFVVMGIVTVALIGRQIQKDQIE